MAAETEETAELYAEFIELLQKQSCMSMDKDMDTDMVITAMM